MITIKPIHFNTFIKNTEKFLKGKDVEYLVNNTHHVKIDNRLKGKCDILYTRYLNKHFSFRQYCLYILNVLLYASDDKLLYEPHSWDMDEICKVGELFSPNRLKRDRELIDKVVDSAESLTIEKLFTINIDGESIIVQWLLENKISPIYIIRYKSKFIYDGNESESHKRVRKIIDAMEKILTQKTIN